jgi:RimJ/RimL family protein N-acetyltransferase
MSESPTRLRAVEPADLPIFFDHQLDAEAAAMAAFPSRDRASFDAHWARVLADPSALNRTVVVAGQVAGNVACFGEPGEREIAYWLGREFWGRGVATAAVQLLLAEVTERPLLAIVAEHNVGSLRVLEKCGFVRTGSEVADDGVTEILLTQAG